MVQEIISNINSYIWGYPYILLLTITSIYLSVKFKFPHFNAEESESFIVKPLEIIFPLFKLTSKLPEEDFKR